jgi:hypothetical protein
MSVPQQKENPAAIVTQIQIIHCIFSSFVYCLFLVWVGLIYFNHMQNCFWDKLFTLSFPFILLAINLPIYRNTFFEPCLTSSYRHTINVIHTPIVHAHAITLGQKWQTAHEGKNISCSQ